MNRRGYILLAFCIFFAAIGGGSIYGSHLLGQSNARLAGETASLSQFVDQLERYGEGRYSGPEIESMLSGYLLSSEFDCVSVRDQTIDWQRDWPFACSDLTSDTDYYVYESQRGDETAVVVAMKKSSVLFPIYLEVGSYGGLLILFALTLLAFGEVRRRQLSQREEELARNAAERLQSTIYASLDAVVTMNEDGICTDFNPAAEEIFGLPKHKIIGERLADYIIPKEYRDAHENGMARFRKTRSSALAGRRLELQAMRANGEVFPTEMVIQVFELDGETNFVAFIRDVSEEKRAAEEREEALARAESAATAKSEFLATMSHEIRTPLNGIIGILGLMRGTTMDTEQKKFIEIGRRSSDALLQLINDILDFSKLEAGKLELDLAPFHAADVVSNVVEMLRPETESKGVALNVDLGIDTDARVMGDAGRLQQVLINILGNAVKFTDEGSVTLDVSEFTDGVDKRRLKVTVTDTGIGIPHDRQPNLFEKFSTGQTTGSGKIPGTGLGLTISRTLVELMEGEIGFESTPGEGSRFWFSIPMPAVAEIEAPSDEEVLNQSQSDISGITPQRILLAEDNPTNSMIARVMLEKEGHSVDTAADGNEAVEAVRSFDYDLVFMDIGMPVMDGVDATQNIRSLPDGRGTLPIVALTAHVLEQEKERLFDAGMDDYLAKPVTREMLLRMVGKWTAGNDDAAAPIDEVPPEHSGPLSEPIFSATPLQQLLADTSPSALSRLVVSFEKTTGDRIAGIVAAVAASDKMALGHESHALGSSAGTFGGQRLFAICRAIEAACMEGDLAQAMALADGIEELSEKTLETVQEQASILIDDADATG